MLYAQASSKTPGLFCFVTTFPNIILKRCIGAKSLMKTVWSVGVIYQLAVRRGKAATPGDFQYISTSH